MDKISKKFLIKQIFRKIERLDQVENPFLNDPEYKQGYKDGLTDLVRNLKFGFT